MSANPKTADVLSHPVRLRILQHIAGREVTTSDLKAALSDIKQATLYRHISALLDAGALTITAEKRVRGATERTLALGTQAQHVDLDELQTVSTQQLRDAFMMFMTHVGQNFERFAQHDDPDLRARLGFSQANLYVSAQDLDDIQKRLTETLMPYMQEQPGENKHRVSLATVLIPDPPQDDGMPTGTETAEDAAD